MKFGTKKFGKILAGITSAAMLLSMSAFALTPSEYDNQSYPSDVKTEDTDGKINLAVIANGDVKIYGDTMYIEGSVYSNGTIYGGNGQGNTIDGLLISGTENENEYTYDGSVVRYGYKHVNDEGHTGTTNGYSVGLNTNGAILDKETSFGYSYTEYDVPTINNYVESAIANQYSNVITVSKDTHYGTLDINGAGLIIDASDGDVTIVVDTMNVTNNPYIATIGEHHVNLYVKNWVSNNNVNLGLMNVKTAGNYNYASGSASVYDNWAYTASSITTYEQVVTDEGLTYNIPRPNETVLSQLDPNKIDFYIDRCNGSDDIVFNGCRIAANIHSNASKLEVGKSLEIYGDITSGCDEFETIGSGYINGTVTVPNAASTVHNSSTIQGQLITNTLLINGAGAILNQSDSLVLPSATATESPSSDDSSIYLNIVEDVVYVVIGSGYPSFTLDKNTNYKWSFDDNDTEYVSFKSNSAGENEYYPGYFTADDVTFNYAGSTGYDAYYGAQPGDVVTVKATSVDDSSVYDTAKIIFVASEEDIPTATATPEPTATPDDSVYDELGAKVIWYDLDAGTYMLGRIKLVGHTPWTNEDHPYDSEYHYTVLDNTTYYNTDETLSDEDFEAAKANVTEIARLSQDSLDNNADKEDIYVYGRIDSNGYRNGLQVTPYCYQEIRSTVGTNMYVCIADGDGRITDAIMVLDPTNVVDDGENAQGEINPNVYDFEPCNGGEIMTAESIANMVY